MKNILLLSLLFSTALFAFNTKYTCIQPEKENYLIHIFIDENKNIYKKEDFILIDNIWVKQKNYNINKNRKYRIKILNEIKKTNDYKDAFIEYYLYNTNNYKSFYLNENINLIDEINYQVINLDIKDKKKEKYYILDGELKRDFINPFQYYKQTKENVNIYECSKIVLN